MTIENYLNDYNDYKIVYVKVSNENAEFASINNFSSTQLRKAFKPIQLAGRSKILKLMIVINSKSIVDLGKKIVEWNINGSKPLKQFTKFHWPNNELTVNITPIYDIVSHYQKVGMIIKFQYDEHFSAKQSHEMVSISAQSANKSITTKSKKMTNIETSSMDKTLIQDKNGYIKVYVDGSCLNNGISNGNVAAGCGVVFNLKHSLNQSGPIRNRGEITNNTAEVQAAVRAIRCAARYNIQRLLILTDSKLVIDFREIYAKWKQNGWKKSFEWDGECLRSANDKTIMNKGDFDSLNQNMINQQRKGMIIAFEYVEGHSGDRYNDLADQLAHEGAKQYAKMHRITL